MSIYQSLYDLLNTYVFGGLVQPESYQDLICILFSTIGCLFLVALPFLLVYKVLSWIGR